MYQLEETKATSEILSQPLVVPRCSDPGCTLVLIQ